MNFFWLKALHNRFKFFLFASIFFLLRNSLSFAQNVNDTLIIKSDDLKFGMPIRDGNNVAYEFLISLDSNLNETEIYENFKATMSIISKNAGIDINTFPIFKIYSSDPLLFEDKNSNRFIYQLNFSTIKKKEEPAAIVNDLIYFIKTDFKIKGNRIRIIIKDIDLYFQMKGVAAFIGPQSSLFKISLNGFTTNMVGSSESGEITITNNQYKTTNYIAKRLFTIDYKINNYLINYLVSEFKKNIRDSNF